MRKHLIMVALMMATTAMATEPELVTVENVHNGVTAPQLVAPSAIPLTDHTCLKSFHGKTKVGFLVDTEGHARNLEIVESSGGDGDRVALDVVRGDTFQPAAKEGHPVVVQMVASVTTQGCTELVRDGHELTRFEELLYQPALQQFAPVKPQHATVAFSPRSPKLPEVLPTLKELGVAKDPLSSRPMYAATAQYSDEGRRKHISGLCVFKVDVNAEGIPQRIKLMQGLIPSMDANALIAIRSYRFHPVWKDYQPIPYETTVEVDFHVD